MAISPIIKETLTRYGLDSLIEWATNAIVNGWSEDQIILELYKRPEFNARFPSIEARRKKGLPPISVDEYLAFEKTVTAQASMWGYNITREEIDGMIEYDVSPVEAERRFDIMAAAVYESPQETRDELSRMFNVSFGDQMKYWANPKEELGVLQQKYRMAEVAGAAIRTGYGELTVEQARTLTNAGLNRGQALEGFGKLVQAGELFQGMDIGEATITQDQQIAFMAGDADVAALIEERASRRKAEFAGGGGYALGREGFATGTAE